MEGRGCYCWVDFSWLLAAWCDEKSLLQLPWWKSTCYGTAAQPHPSGCFRQNFIVLWFQNFHAAYLKTNITVIMGWFSAVIFLANKRTQRIHGNPRQAKSNQQLSDIPWNCFSSLPFPKICRWTSHSFGRFGTTNHGPSNRVEGLTIMKPVFAMITWEISL